MKIPRRGSGLAVQLVEAQGESRGPGKSRVKVMSLKTMRRGHEMEGGGDF